MTDLVLSSGPVQLILGFPVPPASSTAIPAFLSRIAAEDLGTVLEFICSDSTGKAKACTTAESDVSRYLGFLRSTGDTNDTVTIYNAWQDLSGFVGLTPGTEYFARGVNIVSYDEILVDEWTVSVGIASSSTSLFYRPGIPFKRGD